MSARERQQSQRSQGSRQDSRDSQQQLVHKSSATGGNEKDGSHVTSTIGDQHSNGQLDGKKRSRSRSRKRNLSINIKIPQHELKQPSSQIETEGVVAKKNMTEELKQANALFEDLIKSTIRDFQLQNVRISSFELQEKKKKLMKMISLKTIAEVEREQSISDRTTTLKRVFSLIHEHRDSLKVTADEMDAIVAEITKNNSDILKDESFFLHQQTLTFKKKVNNLDFDEDAQKQRCQTNLKTEVVPDKVKLPILTPNSSSSDTNPEPQCSNSEPRVEEIELDRNKKLVKKESKREHHNSEVGKQDDFFGSKSLTPNRRFKPFQKMASLKSPQSLHMKVNRHGSARSIVVSNDNQDLIHLRIEEGELVTKGLRNQSIEATICKSQTVNEATQTKDKQQQQSNQESEEEGRLEGGCGSSEVIGKIVSLKSGSLGGGGEGAVLVSDNSSKHIVSSTMAKSAALPTELDNDNKSQMDGEGSGAMEECKPNGATQHILNSRIIVLDKDSTTLQPSQQQKLIKPPSAKIKSARKQQSKRQQKAGSGLQTPIQQPQQKHKPLKFGKTPVILNKAQSFTRQLQEFKSTTPRGPNHNARGSINKDSLVIGQLSGQPLAVQAQGFVPLTVSNFHSSSKGALFKQPKAVPNFNKEAYATTGIAGFKNDTGISGVGLIGKNQRGVPQQQASEGNDYNGKNSFYGQFRAGKIKKSNRTLHQTAAAPLTPLKGGAAGKDVNDTNLISCDILGKDVTPLSVLTNARLQDPRESSGFAIESGQQLLPPQDDSSKQAMKDDRSKSELFSDSIKKQQPASQATASPSIAQKESPNTKTRVHLNIQTPPMENFNHQLLQQEDARNSFKLKDTTVSLFKDTKQMKQKYGNATNTNSTGPGAVLASEASEEQMSTRFHIGKIETQLLEKEEPEGGDQSATLLRKLQDVASSEETLVRQIGIGQLTSPVLQAQTEQDGAEAFYLVVVDSTSKRKQEENLKLSSSTLARQKEPDGLPRTQLSNSMNHEVVISRIQDKSCYLNDKQSMVESSIININSVGTREKSTERQIQMYAEQVLVTTQSSKKTFGQHESTETLVPFNDIIKMEILGDMQTNTANSINRSSNEGFGSIVKRMEKTKHLNLSDHLQTNIGGIHSDEQRYEKKNVVGKAIGNDTTKLMTERPNQGGLTTTLKSKGNESSITGTNPLPAHLMSGRYSNRESANMARTMLGESVNQSISFGAAGGGGNNQLPYQSSGPGQKESAHKYPATNKISLEQQSVPNAAATDSDKGGVDSREEGNHRQRPQSNVSLFKNIYYVQKSSVSASKELKASPIRKFNAVPTVTSDDSPCEKQQNRKKDIQIEVVDQNSLCKPSAIVTTLSAKTTVQVHSNQNYTLGQTGSLNLNFKQQSVHWNKQQVPAPPAASGANITHDDSNAEREYGYVKDVQQFDNIPPSTGHPSSLRDNERVLKYKNELADKSISPKSSNDQTMIKMPSEPVLPTKTPNFKELFDEKDPAILEERLKTLLVSKNNKLFGTLQGNKNGATGSMRTTMFPESMQTGSHPESIIVQDEYHEHPQYRPISNVFDHNIHKRQQQQSDLSIQGKKSVVSSHNNLHSMISSTGMQQQQQQSRKPQTATGKFVSYQQYPSSILSTIAKKDSFLERPPRVNKFGKTQVFFGKQGGLKSTVSGSLGSNLSPTTVAESGAGQTKNRIATAVSEVQRQVKSGMKKITSYPSFPVDDNTTRLDVTGKNNLRNLNSEKIQIKLINQMKIILDPKIGHLKLIQAGYNFITILFGEQYRPDVAEVTDIISYILTNPQVSLENLIRVSNPLADQMHKKMDQQAQKQKSARGGGQKRSTTTTKVGFGRTISHSGVGKKNNLSQYGKQAKSGDKEGGTMQGSASVGSELKKTNSARKKSPSSKEQSVMALNTIARRMFLQRQHKDKKAVEEEHFEFYQNKEHQSLVQQLRQRWRANLFTGDGQYAGGGTRTPHSTNVSQCSTFDDLSPMRGGGSPDRGGHGSTTYVTQMAKVDMEMKKKRESAAEEILDLSHNLKVRSQSELQLSRQEQKPPLPTKLSDAGKLSQLLNGTTTVAKDNGIDAYLRVKREKALGHQLKSLTKNHVKANITNRLVPKEKAKLTEAIHSYIAAHQLKSTADLAHNSAGSAFHQNNQVAGGAFSLITGESENIKAAYTAVSMYPKEKVNQLLKYRDDIRQQARDSNQISGDKYHLYRRGYSQDTGATKKQDNGIMSLFENKTASGVETKEVYADRRKKVMNQFHTIEKIKQYETGSWSMVPKKVPGYFSQTMLLPPVLEINPPLRQSGHPQQHQVASSDEKKLGAEKEVKLTQHYERIEREMNQVPSMKFKKKELLLEKIILDRALDKVQKRRFVRSNMP